MSDLNGKAIASTPQSQVAIDTIGTTARATSSSSSSVIQRE